MAHSEGIVAGVSEDGKAEVVLQASDPCIPCASEVEVCHCSGGSSRIIVTVLNSVGAAPGDLVAIGHKQGAMMKSISIFLLIPALGLILGALAAAILNHRSVFGGHGAAIMTASGLFIGIMAGIVTYRRVSADIQPFVSRIIQSGLQIPSSLRMLDPVCNMEVDPAMAAGRTTYNGKSYYFCQAGCMETFIKEPAKYAEGRGGAFSSS